MATTPPQPENPASSGKLQLQFSYSFLLADLVLRFACLALWRVSWIPTWGFWLGQLFVIPLAIFIWVIQRQSAIKKKFNVQDAQFESKDTTASIIFVLVIMAHAGFQCFTRVSLSPPWLRIIVAIFLTLLAVAYIFAVAAVSASQKLAPLKKEERPPLTIEPVDENDRILIWLQTQVADYQRMVESYTLESTLIGALAFSAFVTLVSSDKVKVDGVAAFLAGTLSVFKSLFSLNLVELRNVMRFPSDTSILVLAASLALICSMFFVAVIVARLRFNSLVGLANYSNDMASAFNDKEDELYREQLLSSSALPKVEDRLARLRTQITESLGESQDVVRQLRPTITYMRIFRHLGVLTFLAALVASALWISVFLAAAFFLISLLAFSYPALDRWFRDGALHRRGFDLVQGLLNKF